MIKKIKIKIILDMHFAYSKNKSIIIKYKQYIEILFILQLRLM